ncbi:MAG: hypothetical protein Q4D13_04235 [Erysipelotrichaceae bacterium]|nr:hypothetical protein [Erysipelotrichaceae bacterium]
MKRTNELFKKLVAIIFAAVLFTQIVPVTNTVYADEHDNKGFQYQEIENKPGQGNNEKRKQVRRKQGKRKQVRRKQGTGKQQGTGQDSSSAISV